MTIASLVEWIAADWGTTNLRLWLMGPDDTIVEARSSAKGMGSLNPSEFEPALVELVDDALTDDRTLPVIVCGMAGARQGWVEAPYVSVPSAPADISQAVEVPVRDKRLSVYILPGMKQEEPEDVMRGEETQIAGFLSTRPDYRGLLCLPGTHTKWARLEDGKVVSFSTIMTGELFELLSSRSVLRHGLEAGPIDQTAFREAVSESFVSPASLTRSLFGVRAKGLLSGLAPVAAYSRLSGLLIGAELAALQLPEPAAKPVSILGADRLSDIYADALNTIGMSGVKVPADDATLTGLRMAYAQLKDKTR
ncbi:2-dehydro-3-deoxygalactonokinase [Roseibium sp.]|uniref:2-dehydro-3-deoxygalactonokinase n=1 Tax=Roseibium sp. TaxID=1936156 RepID=UPI003A9794C8